MLRRGNPYARVVVPDHKRVRPGTLRQILNEAGVTVEQLLELRYPKDNARVLLAYVGGGLFNELGRVWVCWGDLRTEHMPEPDLRARPAK